MQRYEDEFILNYYLKQEGKQSYTRHIMFCLCQRAVRLLDVDYMQLETQTIKWVVL